MSRGGASLTNTLDTTPFEREAKQLLDRYGTNDLDEALKRENEEQNVHSLADGIVGKALCRNPKCRETFEIPENSKEKPRLCPECRAKEGGIQVSEETVCVIEGCEEERVKSRRVCKEHYNEAQRRNREGGLKPGKKPGKKAVKKPSVHELEKARIEAQYDATHPPAKEPKVQKVDPVYRVGLEDLRELVPKIRTLPSEMEAQAYLQGFFEGRKVSA